MSLFRSLLDVIRPKPQPTDANNRPVPRPFLDLGDAEISQLLELRELPEWDTYLKALDRRSILYGEAMLSATNDRDMVRSQGVVWGLRDAALLLEEAKRESDARKDDNERRRSNAEQWTGHRRAQLFATPAWSVEQRATH